MLTGTIINALAVLAGSGAGLLLKWLAAHFSSRLPAGSAARAHHKPHANAHERSAEHRRPKWTRGKIRQNRPQTLPKQIKPRICRAGRQSAPKKRAPQKPEPHRIANPVDYQFTNPR